MKFPKLITVLICSVSLLAFIQTDLQKHIKNIAKINHLVKNENWHIKQEFKTETDEYYLLHKEIKDTLYVLSFSYFPYVNNYKHERYLKSFVKNNCYHEYSLCNKDTLYYFTSNSNSNPNKTGHAIYLKNMIFHKGWYYYLYSTGHYNPNQKLYFERHKDSLIQLKGSNLPELPFE